MFFIKFISQFKFEELISKESSTQIYKQKQNSIKKVFVKCNS